MHILSPETDNCPSWISRRERMTVENISWSISTKECCRPRQGLNLRPPGLQSDGASNWATEAGYKGFNSVEMWMVGTQFLLHIPATSVLFIKVLLYSALTLVMLIKLRSHAFFKFSANQITWFRWLISFHILNGKQCRSRSVGSSGQGLTNNCFSE